ncbi:hypothetical protein DDB_G0283643 [Dictyostelium discoideum AX4]|uniref:Uncharacterized protein n=1 Tax=Dictyostelium discoideum TaxID=44689 RepID=Q54QU1_DICDI|nr:hypothetical protein DDB_G0283643 [Dictyostelium discoideum AX4]EAL65588.1 hypothetical protein DDB_G0283643 [Dictyostelium discoideum AX4]|eukprot:XP_638932.1 hypothetical protein DDB_G0283643 [Dictyostelium discoideum AX4]
MFNFSFQQISTPNTFQVEIVPSKGGSAQNCGGKGGLLGESFTKKKKKK